VEVNYGLDLEVRLENLVMTGACLESEYQQFEITAILAVISNWDL